MAVREKEVKGERMEVRITSKTKTLLFAAAQVRHKNITEFLVDSAVKEANEVLASPRIFQIAEDKWEELVQSLDSPARSNAALKELFQK